DDWEQVPAVVGGRFVPLDDAVRMAEWLEDSREYVSGHEEEILLPRVVVAFRTFHSCQGEPAAQAVAASGLLPAGFRQPARWVYPGRGPGGVETSSRPAGPGAAVLSAVGRTSSPASPSLPARAALSSPVQAKERT